MNDASVTSKFGFLNVLESDDFVTNCCVTNVTSMTSNRNQYLNLSYLAPCLVVLTVASVLGTFGNLMILIIAHTRKSINTVETTFIVNLALSDLFVTSVADPMSFIAKIEGEHFFDKVPGLCQTIASLCTISCVTSLMTIAVMSINRYFYICAHDMYERIFTKWNCVCICISLYFIGGVLVLLNALDIGDHGFDRKSLECIWDRMATFYYTVVFSVTLVWIPSIITGACYLRIYLYVRKHRRRIQEQTQGGSQSSIRSSHLAKTLFLIYAVFITCWAPYALLIVLDSNDTYPHELHVYITMFAHLHPSLNWLIYYITNKNFADAYRQLLRRCVSCKKGTPVMSFALAKLDDNSRRKGTHTDLSSQQKDPAAQSAGKTLSPTGQTKLTALNVQENGQMKLSPSDNNLITLENGYCIEVHDHERKANRVQNGHALNGMENGHSAIIDVHVQGQKTNGIENGHTPNGTEHIHQLNIGETGV